MEAAGGASANAEKHLLTNPKYRPDIDGLRGIAVLAVVGFHTFPQAFKGGFVGVDIFFVISGFLISSILFKKFEEDRFSYSEFYSRRVKRIFPALIVILIPCWLFGWLFIPTEFAQLGKHVAAGAGFVSNFAFWHEVGYFDFTAEKKPLLHLWSLGIEEQFYIFWPLLLGLCRRRKLNFLWITLLIALASFATNLYLIKVDPVAAFYSPLSRFWELMMGGLLAYLTLHRPQSLPRGMGWAPLAGFLLILGPIFLLDQEKPFPGWWAALPVLGSFLTISAGPMTCLNSKILGNRILVSFGLISYPLYLWHWPVLYAARRLLLYRVSGSAIAEVLFGSVLLSILLSWLTYRIIEVPIRFGRAKKKATRPLVVMMVVLLLAGIITYQTNGFGFLYSVQAMEILNIGFKTIAAKSYRERSCFLDHDQDASQFKDCTSRTASPPAESVLLWGDSHAAHLYPGLVDHIGPATQLTQFTTSGCPPLVGVEIKRRKHCREINDFVLDYVTRVRPDRIILAGAWPGYDWQSVGETVARLKKLQIRHIDLVGPVPTWGSGLPAALFKYSRLHPQQKHLPMRMTLGVAGNAAEVDRIMETFAGRLGVTYFSPYKILCNSAGCITRLGDSPESVVTWDGAHLTKAGSDYVVAHLYHGLLP